MNEAASFSPALENLLERMGRPRHPKLVEAVLVASVLGSAVLLFIAFCLIRQANSQAAVAVVLAYLSTTLLFKLARLVATKTGRSRLFAARIPLALLLAGVAWTIHFPFMGWAAIYLALREVHTFLHEGAHAIAAKACSFPTYSFRVGLLEIVWQAGRAQFRIWSGGTAGVLGMVGAVPRGPRRLIARTMAFYYAGGGANLVAGAVALTASWLLAGDARAFAGVVAFGGFAAALGGFVPVDRSSVGGAHSDAAKIQDLLEPDAASLVKLFAPAVLLDAAEGREPRTLSREEMRELAEASPAPLTAVHLIFATESMELGEPAAAEPFLAEVGKDASIDASVVVDFLLLAAAWRARGCGDVAEAKRLIAMVRAPPGWKYPLLAESVIAKAEGEDAGAAAKRAEWLAWVQSRPESKSLLAGNGWQLRVLQSEPPPAPTTSPIRS